VPDVYEVPLPLSFRLAGVVAVGTSPLRKVVPFDHEVVGTSLTAATAPAGAALIADILHGPAGAAGGALTSLWATSGNAGRPQIAAGSNDQAPAAATNTTVMAQGTNPPGYTGTTTRNYLESPYLVRPDVSASTTQQAGSGAAAGGNVGEPFNEGPSTDVVQGQTETGMRPASANMAFQGAAGDVYQLAIVQVGSTTAGSDLELILWILPR
jgi:hypothetical protein